MVKKDELPPESLFPKTRRFKSEQEGEKLKITAHWAEWIFAILFGSVFVCCQMLPYSLLLFLYKGEIKYLFILIAACGLSFMIVYSTLVSWFNKTIIKVSREEIEIKAGPLPWPGIRPLRLEAKAIHQITLVNKFLGYELHAIYGEQRRKVLLLQLLSQAVAFYLEEEISNYLSLPLPADRFHFRNCIKKKLGQEFTVLRNATNFMLELINLKQRLYSLGFTRAAGLKSASLSGTMKNLPC